MATVTTVTDTAPNMKPLILSLSKASSSSSSSSSSSTNPLFIDWFSLNRYGLPPFHLIRPEHFSEAFDMAMQDEANKIQAIVDRDDEATATFDNTMVALESASSLISLVHNVFSNLQSSHTNDEIDELSNVYEPKLALHNKKILLNAKLYKRICHIFEQHQNSTSRLDADQFRLVETWKQKMHLAGVSLSDAQKQRLQEIASRQAELENRFGQNVLKSENSFSMELSESNGDLDGLPQFVLDNLSDGVDEKGNKKYKIKSLSRSYVDSFLTFSTRDDLRQKVYTAFRDRGDSDNDSTDVMNNNRLIIKELLLLRHEEAKLLSFKNYSDFKLVNSMAQTPANVKNLLENVWEPAKSKAKKEKEQLESERQSSSSSSTSVGGADWMYYSERVRKRLFDIDELELKPYFELENMNKAVFYVTEQLFNLEYVEIPVGEGTDVPALYHPSVKAYEVKDRSTGKVIAIFLHDNFARSSKRSGAWMSNFRGQSPGVIPIIANNNNFIASSDGVTLLSFDELRTLFHEFGHGLHGTLSNVRYSSQSGTNVLNDFVEFPSQLYEHWMEQSQLLQLYAKHYQTNEPIPTALLNKLMKSLKHNKGFDVVEYVSSTMLDLALHHLSETELNDKQFDVVKFEHEYAATIGLPSEVGYRHCSIHFQHLFSGSSYASAYYVYLWAQTLDADGFSAFLESGDIFDKELAARLKVVYSSGDSKHPMELYKYFRGREPTVDALLKKLDLN